MAVESDWALLRAALPDLQNYVLSSDVYWPLGSSGSLSGGRQLPQLTIGNLMLSEARLAAAVSESKRGELAELQQQLHRVREEWRSNWSLKAGREFGSRLNLWQQYIQELRGDPRGHAKSYPSEVRKRAILRLLRHELLDGVPANEEELLTMLDQILRGLTRPGSFVWEPEVEAGFPSDAFWFLYVHVG